MDKKAILNFKKYVEKKGKWGQENGDRFIFKIKRGQIDGRAIFPNKAMLSDSLRSPQIAALCGQVDRMKTTKYFEAIRTRPDRAIIKSEWIQFVIDNPISEVVQEDGRLRRWAQINEMKNRYLRGILLEDGETVHNAFFDRGFQP